uniref:Glycosyl hydrolase, family 31 n=1 Tax=Globodera pallida TaxID=36090 RepID=A0A183BXK8_GLOPA
MNVKSKTSGQERYWLSSKKVALNVPWRVPLWTSMQKGELSLRAQLKDSQFLLRNNNLEYTLSVDKHGNLSLKDFHQQCFAKLLKAPTAAPDTLMMEKPIWSTWANFWTTVNQTQVESFVDQIVNYGLPISQLELDDTWTTAYGDYQIDAQKFPDFGGMVKTIANKTGARLTAWVHPFVNKDSVNGGDLSLRNKIFMKSMDGDVPLTWWWDCPVVKEPCAFVETYLIQFF